MSASSRITRPQPIRSEPIRAFTGGHAAPASNDGAGAGPQSVGDAVADAVDLGYRVLDEYLRQGQSAARRFGVRPERAEAAVDDLQALATRMARYTSDFLGVWAQFVEVALSAGGLTTPAAARATDAGRPPSPVQTPPRPAVAVRVASRQAAEVTAEVAADMVARSLTVQALRSADPLAAPVAGVRFEPATGSQAARVHVVVPPDQPPGTYVGVIVDDETGRFAGTVTVTLLGGEG